MIIQDDLDAAVTQGIIDQAQAVRIAHLALLWLAVAYLISQSVSTNLGLPLALLPILPLGRWRDRLPPVQIRPA